MESLFGTIVFAILGVIIVAWMGISFLIYKITPGDQRETATMTADANALVVKALLNRESGSSENLLCPKCKSLIIVDGPFFDGSAGVRNLFTRCMCGLCSGKYQLQ